MKSTNKYRINHASLFALALIVGLFASSGSMAASSQNKADNPSALYLKDVVARIKNYWATADTKPGKVTASWRISSSGAASDIKIIKHGTNADYDKAVLSAIKAAAPYAPPPPEIAAPCDIELSFEAPKPLRLSVNKAAAIYCPPARKHLQPIFESAGLNYPPKKLKWVCLKEERLLLVFAPKPDGNWVELMCLPVRGASGTSGPKLKTGDLQVPEGFYRIARLDAALKLLMWVNYPNAFDWSHAQKEHRIRPGYGIQIHGGSYSTGCLAMGNDKIGDLWTLAHDTGINNIELIYSPCNLLVRKPKLDFTKQPPWLPGLYKLLQSSLSTLPVREQI